MKQSDQGDTAMRQASFIVLLFALLPVFNVLEGVTIIWADDDVAADWIIHNAKVGTVDAKFSIAQAIAIKGDRILAVGDKAAVMRHKGSATKVLDLEGRMVLPGLYDSHG